MSLVSQVELENLSSISDGQGWHFWQVFTVGFWAGVCDDVDHEMK